MSFTLDQIKETLDNLCIISGDKSIAIEKIENAERELREALKELNGLTVAGRGVLDTLLGCMMALEQIVGQEE